MSFARHDHYHEVSISHCCCAPCIAEHAVREADSLELSLCFGAGVLVRVAAQRVGSVRALNVLDAAGALEPQAGVQVLRWLLCSRCRWWGSAWLLRALLLGARHSLSVSLRLAATVLYCQRFICSNCGCAGAAGTSLMRKGERGVRCARVCQGRVAALLSASASSFALGVALPTSWAKHTQGEARRWFKSAGRFEVEGPSARRSLCPLRL